MSPELVLAAALAAAIPTCMDDTETNQLYDVRCCCTHGWCAPLPDNHVRETTGGYIFTVPPKGHPKLDPGSHFAPHVQSTVSPDGRWHVCGSGTLITCFYFVPGGV